MAENEVYEYSLGTEETEQSLKMTIKNNNIYFVIENSNGERYSGFVSLSQIKQVCKAFNTTKTLNEALVILHNTIEGGNIFLTEDEEEKNIELKFAIKLASGDFPPFSIVLELEEATPLKEPKQEPLPPKNENKVIKEPMNATKKTTEANKPIAKSNGNDKKVPGPGMTAKSTKLSQMGIKSKEGQKNLVNQAPLGSVPPQKNLSVSTKVDNYSTKYSLQSVPVPSYSNMQNASNNIIDNNTLLQSYDGTSTKYSQYSTYSVPSKPVVYSDHNYLNSNTFDFTQNNGVVEYSPNIINQDIYTNSSSNTYFYTQLT